jgi:DNA-binding NarL/FixJ family response regulator
LDSATYEKLCFLLTDEEKAVLDLKRRGFGNAEIAAELNLSERTVNRRVKAIVGKLKAE